MKTFTIAALGIVLAGCSKKTEAHKETLPTVPVRVGVVERQPHTATEQVMGSVQPKLKATLEAKIAGRIQQLPVAQGQRVKAGDLIAELDLREVRAKLDQALAGREQTERDWKRQKALLQQQSATQSDYDAAESRYHSAQAAVAELEAMVDLGKVSAPFDGIISRKTADVGDLATPGKPLVEIEQPKALRFEANVPESLINRVKTKDVLSVHIPAITKSVKGIVSEIAPVVDQSTRTFLVKLDMPDADGLRSGFFGRVDVPLDSVPWVTVPNSALVRRGQMEIVFVVTNNAANLRLVKTGKHSGDSVEILSGIATGESIVLANAAGLVDGQRVEMK